MTLADLLARAATTPWEWGVSDCSTFPADWVIAHTGVDPMSEWRGSYSSEDEAREVVRAAGGLVAMFASGMDALWPRVFAPSAGAVGVVELRGEDGGGIDVGAIHTGRRWAIRSPRGIAMISEPLAVRAIWAR